MTKFERNPNTEYRFGWGINSLQHASCLVRHSSLVIGHFPCSVLLAICLTASSFAATKLTYESDVQPILREHCFACHSQDEAKSGLALDSFDALTTGGAGGEVVVAGDPEASRLWKLVTHQESPKMPPGDKLPDEQLSVLRAWIKGGLLKDASSKPLKSKKPAIATLEADKLGKPVGEPAMPEQLFHEPVVWAPRPGPIDTLATSPWAPLVAIAWQRQVSFYHTDTHELLGIVPYVEGLPRVVRFSRDGSLLLVAGGRHGAAGSAALFDVKTGTRLTTLGDELDIVLAADISPDLSLVAIGGPKKKVRVYRVSDGSLAYQLDKHTDWITALGFSPDGKLLATADRGGGALLWQAIAGHERGDLRGHKAAITSLDWRADSTMLATASEDGTVRLWNPGGQQIKSIEAHKSGVLSVRFSQTGNWVTAGRNQQVKTWKPDGVALADLGKLSGMALAAAFIHDGAKVIASDYSGAVQVIDVESRKHIATLSANPQTLVVRLAEANQALQQAQQKVAETEKLANQSLAALDQAKVAHAAHEKKLTAAQKTMNDRRAQLDELTRVSDQQTKEVEAARKPMEQLTIVFAEAQKTYSAAKKESDDQDQPEDESKTQLAELQQLVQEAEAALSAGKENVRLAEQQLEATHEKRQAAQQNFKLAEATLSKVSDETSGLPDLVELDKQHELTKVKLVAAQHRLEAAQTSKARVEKQQADFAQGTHRFDAELKTRRSELQQLAKESGKLEAKHSQAAAQLDDHRTQLGKIAEQLKLIQTQLAELQSTETKLAGQEKQLSRQIKSVQEKLASSQQKVEILETAKKDFEVAQELREKYATRSISAHGKTTAGQE